MGVENRMESRSPNMDPATDSTAEQIVTARKLRNSRMAERAGKIIRAEISSAPTSFMASTMTTPLTAAISIR